MNNNYEDISINLAQENYKNKIFEEMLKNYKDSLTKVRAIPELMEFLKFSKGTTIVERVMNYIINKGFTDELEELLEKQKKSYYDKINENLLKNSLKQLGAITFNGVSKIKEFSKAHYKKIACILVGVTILIPSADYIKNKVDEYNARNYVVEAYEQLGKGNVSLEYEQNPTYFVEFLNEHGFSKLEILYLSEKYCVFDAKCAILEMFGYTSMDEVLIANNYIEYILADGTSVPIDRKPNYKKFNKEYAEKILLKANELKEKLGVDLEQDIISQATLLNQSYENNQSKGRSV